MDGSNLTRGSQAPTPCTKEARAPCDSICLLFPSAFYTKLFLPRTELMSVKKTVVRPGLLFSLYIQTQSYEYLEISEVMGFLG